jgi:hypothetical protein
MELRRKTLSSISKHDYYIIKLDKYFKYTNYLMTHRLIDKESVIRRIAMTIKWMNYHFKYFWMYIDTCDSMNKKSDILQWFSMMYHKTFDIQEEINYYYDDEDSYNTDQNFRKKCLSYRLLYEKKFESIFSSNIHVPIDILRYILLFV